MRVSSRTHFPITRGLVAIQGHTMNRTFKLSPIAAVVMGASLAATQSVVADDDIEEVIVRSSPLQSTIDEIVLG